MTHEAVIPQIQIIAPSPHKEVDSIPSCDTNLNAPPPSSNLLAPAGFKPSADLESLTSEVTRAAIKKFRLTGDREDYAMFICYGSIGSEAFFKISFNCKR